MAFDADQLPPIPGVDPERSYGSGETPFGDASAVPVAKRSVGRSGTTTVLPQQPDFMSDIDSSTAKVQRDLVPAAQEAQKAQTLADKQRDDATKKDRERMDVAWGNESARAGDPALEVWDADKEKANRVRGPMEQFGSVGFIFAMAASAFTRTPMTSALNAGAAAMTAIQQGDEKAYEHAYKAWKDNSDLAIRRFDMEHRLYEDANKLIDTDMNLWKQKTLEIATQFDDKKTIAMLEMGLEPKVLEAQASLARSRLELVKAKEGMEEIKWRGDMIKDGLQALQQDPTWKAKSPEQQSVAKAQVYARAVRASKGMESREPTGIQEFTGRWWAEHPNGTAEEFSTAFGEFMRGQRLPGSVSGRPLTMSQDQVQRIKELTDTYISQGMSQGEAHSKAAQEVQEKDSKARATGKDKIDQALVNELEKYPGMTKEDLGYIPTTRQPKVVAAVIESPGNLEAIAKYTKENPNALGLIADASKRINLDAYQALFKSNPAEAKARIDADRDKAIDTVAQERKLDMTQAAKAKVLQKMLTTQAFTDAAIAGSRGATIYLDKAFKEIYDPTSSPGAFFSILEKRYDEADRVAREYKLGFNDRSPEALAEMPFWTGKAAGYAGTLVEKPPVPGAVHAKDGWYVETTPDAPGARKAKNGKWYNKVP